MRDPTKRVTALQGLPIDKRTRRKTSPHLYIAAAHAQIRGPYYFLGGKIGPFGPIFYGDGFWCERERIHDWGEPERAPLKALRRLRSQSRTSCPMRMREVYVDSIPSSKVSRGRTAREEARLSRAQGKPERYRCASESDRARHSIYALS